ncbi:MAG: ubiquitin-like protein UBact [Limisphaerales bacterium]
MPEQNQKVRSPGPGPSGGGGDGPKTPEVEKPNTEDLLKRMKKVDPDQARRYRQRTGE